MTKKLNKVALCLFLLEGLFYLTLLSGWSYLIFHLGKNVESPFSLKILFTFVFLFLAFAELRSSYKRLRKKDFYLSNGKAFNQKTIASLMKEVQAIIEDAYSLKKVTISFLRMKEQKFSFTVYLHVNDIEQVEEIEYYTMDCLNERFEKECDAKEIDIIFSVIYLHRISLVD